MNGLCKNPCLEASPCNADQECQVHNHDMVCVKVCQCQQRGDCPGGQLCDGCNCIPQRDITGKYNQQSSTMNHNHNLALSLIKQSIENIIKYDSIVYLNGGYACMIHVLILVFMTNANTKYDMTLLRIVKLFYFCPNFTPFY